MVLQTKDQKLAKLHKFMNPTSAEQTFKNGLCPELYQVIIDHVIAGAGADSRRRTDVCKTLNDLHAALSKAGYSRSRQALYPRLIPQRADSNEGALECPCKFLNFFPTPSPKAYVNPLFIY